jgi:hypothetical protein
VEWTLLARRAEIMNAGDCKGTPLTSPETSSGEPLPLLFSSAANRSSGTISAVLLVERTAEALPMTSDIPLFLFVCLFLIMA